MKEIYYTKEKTFRLTDREFGEGILAWNARKNYYCLRLQALLTPRFSFIENSTDNDLFYSVSGIEVYRINENLYRDLSGDIKFKDNKGRDEFVKKLVSEDEYYDNKKYLKV